MIQLNANHVWYLITAAQWTVLLSLIAFAGGGVCGLAVALGRNAGNPVLRRATIGFTYCSTTVRCAG